MRTWILALLANAIITNVVVAAPLVYSGHTVSFSKAPFDDHTLPTNQDRILSDVIITRGESAGIYNIAQEDVFELNVSPVGTAWAFEFNNPGDTLAASNWAALTFQDWQTSLGGANSLFLTILEGDGVVHLIEQDIYLDIRFTDWSVGLGTGGGVTYARAALTPSADFDRNGDIDGRDFLTWQRNSGASDPLQSHGDANFDGSVNAADLAIWQGAYNGALTAFTTLPEPSGLSLSTLAVIGAANFRRNSRNGHRLS